MDNSQPRRLEEHIAWHLLQIVVLLGVAMLQVTLLPAPFGFPLNPLLILVIVVTLLRGLAVGARLAFYSGIALDLVSTMPLGSHALALLLAIVMVALLAAGFSRENLLLPVIAMLVGAICYELTIALIYRLVPSWAEWRTYALAVIVPSALLATIPALPCYQLLRWWDRRHTVPEITGSRL